jgi:molybdopterin synthase sulfur carrier subunit
MVQLNTITIRVLAFGITKEIVGGRSVDVEVDDGATVGDIRTKLLQSFPPLQQLACLRMAVNNEFAEEDQIVDVQDELALLPPVSGG